jgi:hypothetical protein
MKQIKAISIIFLIGIMAVMLSSFALAGFASTYLPNIDGKPTLITNAGINNSYYIYLQNQGNNVIYMKINILIGNGILVNSLQDQYAVPINISSDNYPLELKLKIPSNSSNGAIYKFTYSVLTGSSGTNGLVSFSPVGFEKTIYISNGNPNWNNIIELETKENETQPITPTCDDGIKNQDETGIDCGGVCSACKKTPSGGSGGGGGGGGSSRVVNTSVSINEYGNKVYSISNADLKIGYTQEIEKTSELEFNINGILHHINIISLISNKATINISSIPQQVTLSIGETKEVDVDYNGKSDLSIKLNSIDLTSNKIILSIKSIIEDAEGIKVIENGIIPSSVSLNASNSSWKRIIVFILIGVIALVGISFTIFKFITRNKEDEYESSFEESGDTNAYIPI